ncbi:hypothetical protein [Mesorhizobium sp.]|uniref:hypothetical protein n=1 Tax=Mesorhizobium sp. TaxID=1871066 RepID=UPI0025D0A415|nr:hypothetical protein [Mesorhizobium sp.]
MAFDAKIAPLLEVASTLKINAVTADTGPPVSLTISLAGFSGAVTRSAELSAD